MLLKLKPIESPESCISVSDQVPIFLSRYDIRADTVAYYHFKEGKLLSQERRNAQYSFRLHYIMLNEPAELLIHSLSGIYMFNMLEGMMQLSSGRNYFHQGAGTFKLFYLPNADIAVRVDAGNFLLLDFSYCADKLQPFASHSLLLQDALDRLNKHHSNLHAYPSSMLPLIIRERIQSTIQKVVEPQVLRAFEESILLDENLKRYVYANLSIDQGGLNEKGVSGVKQLGYYLMQNPCEVIRVHDLAKRFNYDCDTMLKTFKKCYKMSITSFQRLQRINMALDLLKNSHLTVTEICDRCGYYDRTHFNKQFKKVVGILPGKVRQMQQDSECNFQSSQLKLSKAII